MNQEQAEAGLAVLKERQAENEYLGRMWVPQIEKRTEEGQDLVSCIEMCLDRSAEWIAQAVGSSYPTGPQFKTTTMLFKATEQDVGDYGYKISEEELNRRNREE